MMKTIRILTISSIASLLIAAPLLSSAKEDGKAGMTSTAKLDMNLTLPPVAMVSNLSDIITNVWYVEDAFKSKEMAFCVYSTQAASAYYISVQGTNFPADGLTPGQERNDWGFQLNPEGNPLLTLEYFKYQVNFYPNGAATGTPVQMSSQTKYGPFTGSLNQTCDGASNAAFMLNFKSSAKSDALISGLYKDTLNVTVSPV